MAIWPQGSSFLCTAAVESMLCRDKRPIAFLYQRRIPMRGTVNPGLCHLAPKQSVAGSFAMEIVHDVQSTQQPCLDLIFERPHPSHISRITISADAKPKLAVYHSSNHSSMTVRLLAECHWVTKGSITTNAKNSASISIAQRLFDKHSVPSDDSLKKSLS
jgi:hypothetical protein